MVMMYSSTPVHTLIAKTAQYGVLKIRIPSMKDLYTPYKSQYVVLSLDGG
jgi:hypothetical protein